MSLYARGYIDAVRFIERTMWKPDFDDLDAPDDREQYKRGWEDGLKHGARVAGTLIESCLNGDVELPRRENKNLRLWKQLEAAGL